MLAGILVLLLHTVLIVARSLGWAGLGRTQSVSRGTQTDVGVGDRRNETSKIRTIHSSNSLPPIPSAARQSRGSTAVSDVDPKARGQVAKVWIEKEEEWRAQKEEPLYVEPIYYV